MLANRLFNAFALLLTSAYCGCAQLGVGHATVDLPIWHPPQPQANGIRRVAVATFTGHSPLNAAVRQSIVQRLAESGYFEIVPLPPAGGINEQSTNIAGSRALYEQISHARSLGTDTLLVGTVQAGYGGTQIGNLAIGDPEVKVVVNVKVIDVVNGRLRDHQQVVKAYKGEVDARPGSATSEANLFDRLGRECVDELVSNTFARRTTTPIPLAAVGRDNVSAQQANLLATQGRWSQATAAWQTALATEPNNDALLYNLGITYEAQQNFPLARASYQAALSVRDNEVVRTALRRTEGAEQRFLIAMQQRLPALAPREHFVGHAAADYGPIYRTSRASSAAPRPLPPVY